MHKKRHTITCYVPSPKYKIGDVVITVDWLGYAEQFTIANATFFDEEKPLWGSCGWKYYLTKRGAWRVLPRWEKDVWRTTDYKNISQKLYD